jgi:arabinofuranan 3-O-arabinosyltransferase
VSASAYGNNVTFTPGDRAVMALDGDETTGWKVGAFDDPTGAYLVIHTDEPVTTDQVTLLQNPGTRNRWITDVTLSFDGGDPVHAVLDESSRTSPGQVVTFPERSFDTLRITVDRTDPPDAATFRGLSDVGFAEVGIPGVGPIDEVIRPPVDLLDVAGEDSIDRGLTYLFTRRGGNGIEPDRNPEEATMRRWVEGPVARSYTPYGRARLNRWLGDDSIDALVGLPSAAEGGVTATSSARLPGDLRSRASAAVDGDLLTAYQTPVNSATGHWVEYTYSEPVSLDELALAVVNDGKHSIPSVVSLSVDGGPAQQVSLPSLAVATDGERGHTDELRAEIAPVTGTTFRLSIDQVTEARSTDWFGGVPIVLPVGLAEAGLPVVEAPAADAALPSACRGDLVRIDDGPVPLEVRGTVGEALAGDGVDLAPCGAPVDLPAGRSLLESTSGSVTGYDVDILAISSAAGGAPGVDTLSEPADAGPPPPETTTERTGRNSHRVRVTDADEPYWVVLGQSWSPGFAATVEGGRSLGEPTLINGYANGWRIDPAVDGSDVVVDIAWTPQRVVWAGLAVSALGVLICLALIVVPLVRRRRPAGADGPISSVAPVLASPWEQDGPVLSWRTTAVVTAAASVVGVVVGSVPIGVVLGVATLAACRLARGQLVVRLLSAGMFAAAAAFIIARQFHARFVVDFNWVRRFEVTHAWALLAVFAMLVAVVVDALRRRGEPAPELADQPDS